MATITSIKSSYWSDPTAWDLGRKPEDEDQIIINTGHKIMYGASMDTGVSGITLNGVLCFDTGMTGVTLKVNGNIEGTGELWACDLHTLGQDDPWSNYEQFRTYIKQGGFSLPYFVDSPAPNVYISSYWNPFTKILYDRNIELIDISTIEGLETGDYINYLNTHPGTYLFDTENTYIFVHTPDNTVPTDNVDLLIPFPRQEEGNEYCCLIQLNSDGKINVPIIRFHGWHREIESSTLSQNAAINDFEISINDDLDLQNGDVIGLGNGKINGQLSTNEIYNISGYNSFSKVVTLNSPLQSDHLSGDSIIILNSPIKIERTDNSMNQPLIPNEAKINNVYLSGCTLNLDIREINNPLKADLLSGWEINHSKIYDQASFLAYGLVNSVIKSCNAFGAGKVLGLADSVYNSIIEDCHAVNTTVISRSNCKLLKSSEQNSPYVSDCKLLSDFVSKNGFFPHGRGTVINDSYIDVSVEPASLYDIFGVVKFINSTIKLRENVHTPLFKAYNCLIGGEILLEEIEDGVLESFDHNQIKGNYKAWCQGGTIETNFNGETCNPGHLIFNCQNPINPVFRDFQVLLPAYRTQIWQALTKKSFTDGSVKIELIDPANDPLIDPSSAPLASYSLPDVANTNLPLKLGYKSSKPMVAILRVSAQNNSGTVEVDTRLIENRVQHGQ